MRAANPESVAAEYASPGAGATVGANRGARGARGRSVLFFLRDGFSTISARAAAVSCPLVNSHHAPLAAITFSITPTQVVARSPMAGIRKKPAAIAPAAAPAVFTA